MLWLVYCFTCRFRWYVGMINFLLFFDVILQTFNYDSHALISFSQGCASLTAIAQLKTMVIARDLWQFRPLHLVGPQRLITLAIAEQPQKYFLQASKQNSGNFNHCEYLYLPLLKFISFMHCMRLHKKLWMNTLHRQKLSKNHFSARESLSKIMCINKCRGLVRLNHPLY